MNALDLVANVAADYLEARIAESGAADGTARFLLDKLTGPQAAAVCREILLRPNLASQCDVRMPRSLLAGQDVPDSILTDQRTTYWRTAECPKPVLVVANTEDDQGQSLRELTPIDQEELLGEAEAWVRHSARGAGLTDQIQEWWAKALAGLQAAKPQSLMRFADFVLLTRKRMLDDGMSLVQALGCALPALQAPRDSGCFEGIPEKARTRKDKWKQVFGQVFTKRAPYLLKQTQSHQPISTEDLAKTWETIRDAVQTNLHPVFEAFIAAPAKCTPAAEALAGLEWEDDKVVSLFDGIKDVQKVPLGAQTLHFFEDFDENPLVDDEINILAQMDKRGAREANDDEREFYERHEKELAEDRRLKSRWERYVFGAPIECEDFQIGLLQAVGRLFDRASGSVGPWRLRVEAKKKRKRDWLTDHSFDAVNFFCLRYRGFDGVIGAGAQWEVRQLFHFDRIAEEAAKNRKFKKNTSASKAANQIRFDVYLEPRQGTSGDSYSVQLVWKFNPDSVQAEFPNDFKRLLARPLVECEVPREPVSVKGRIQSVDLSDSSTFKAVYRTDKGSLVAAYEPETDIGKYWPKALGVAREENRITPAGFDAMSQAWAEFADKYSTALNEFCSAGVGSESILTLESAYENLLAALQDHAPGDRNRLSLWLPVLRIGTVAVTGGGPTAIVAPWHPLRLLAMAAKARQVGGLIRYMLQSKEVNFGDAKLFFADLSRDLADAYYPEVAVGFRGSEPLALTVSDTCGDYTLMEPPIRQATEGDATSDNPQQTAKDALAVVARYVELQPHERANLSLVLFNCDSARLPEAVVEELGKLYEDEEDVRCQVILRHRDPQKLMRLYQSLLQGSDRDVDTFVASEASRDFMARLRIGIMADEAPTQSSIDGPPHDLVFLQDVIARLAQQAWILEPEGAVPPSLLDYYPPRWSRRKPAAKDDLRSVTYLACPAQPEVGWRYLDVVRCVHTGEAPDPRRRHLPARMIKFENNDTRLVFEEIHRIGQWVVNYDELLDRRQLRNQGVQIIRFQQRRHKERNVIISSKAPLGLLDVMITRCLRDLDLGLCDEELFELAKRMRQDASEISGNIVLRAAKRRRFVNELIGLALGRFLVEQEIGANRPVGWYFLDDYAYWLGQREEQLADILAISPGVTADGQKTIALVITECKYVDGAGLDQAAKRSQSQIRETVVRVDDALFGDPGRLDRDLWLSRIADMILDGIELPAHHPVDLAAWRNGIRDGSVRISLRGYSQVFIHTAAPGTADPSERIPVPKASCCWQELYGSNRVREIVLAYHNKLSPLPIRSAIGPTEPWNEVSPRSPTPPVRWAAIAGPTNPPEEPGDPDDESPPTAGGSGGGQGSSGGGPPSTPPSKPESRSRTDSGTRPERKIDGATLPRSTAVSPMVPTPPASVGMPSESSTHDSVQTEFAWAKPALARVLSTLVFSLPAREDDLKWLQETETRLSDALRSYDLQAKRLSSRLTPNAAIIRFQGSDRLRVADVENRRAQLLTTHKLKVINVSADPGQVVVAVARTEREIVSLIEVLRRRTVDDPVGRANQSLILGVKESDGGLLYLSPGGKHAPHSLIAGTTGSGKSVLIQNLLLDIAMTNSTFAARITLIDPKQGVDYFDLQGLPHLQGGIVVTQEAARTALESAVAEMDRRYALFGAARVSNLVLYNSKVPAAEREPVLWIVHDEFAVWMLTEGYQETVSSTVQRLGVMSRAAGIFLIFAAQRPEDRVMPLQLRDNLGNRLVLRVESPGTSRIALGEEGAEQLLGKGHLAARLQNEEGIIVAQVPILSPEEIRAIVAAIQHDDESPSANR